VLCARLYVPLDSADRHLESGGGVSRRAYGRVRVGGSGSGTRVPTWWAIEVPPPVRQRRDRRGSWPAAGSISAELAGSWPAVTARTAQGRSRASQRLQSLAPGDWCNGNMGVSKTLARGSIPRSPASVQAAKSGINTGFRGVFRSAAEFRWKPLKTASARPKLQPVGRGWRGSPGGLAGPGRHSIAGPYLAPWVMATWLDLYAWTLGDASCCSRDG
jgi:hypothetical protein